MTQKPSFAFIAASWVAFGTGIVGYFAALSRASLQLSEKGYYFTIIMFGLFSAISVQKCVRDRLEKIPVTDLYYGISWFCTILSITLLTIGLWNAEMWSSEKGMYAFSFILSLFGVIAIQKNTRDILASDKSE